MFEQPWDTAAQNAALAVAARTAHGVVAVSPQPPVQPAEDHDAATGNFRARVAVLVLVQRNVTAADAPKRAAGCMAALLAVLRGFDPQGNGIPYAEPRVDGIDRLNAARLVVGAVVGAAVGALCAADGAARQGRDGTRAGGNSQARCCVAVLWRYGAPARQYQ